MVRLYTSVCVFICYAQYICPPLRPFMLYILNKMSTPFPLVYVIVLYIQSMSIDQFLVLCLHKCLLFVIEQEQGGGAAIICTLQCHKTVILGHKMGSKDIQYETPIHDGPQTLCLDFMALRKYQAKRRILELLPMIFLIFGFLGPNLGEGHKIGILGSRDLIFF